MWHKLHCCFWGFTLCGILLVVSGCDYSAAQETVDSAKDVTILAGELADAEYKVYVGLITAALSVVGGVIGILKERKRTRQMKEAIVSKAEQIDRLVLSSEASTSNPGSVVTKFMKADMRLRDRAEKKALHTFDRVREGIL